MEISSRTPEGEPNRCPVCGKTVRLEPSGPIGDAPCPHCGHLLIFVAFDAGVWLFRKRSTEHVPFAGRAGHTPGFMAAGDQVRVREGPFDNFEGTVASVDQEYGRVTVTINIFGRGTPVELESWQVEVVGWGEALVVLHK